MPPSAEFLFQDLGYAALVGLVLLVGVAVVARWWLRRREDASGDLGKEVVPTSATSDLFPVLTAEPVEVPEGFGVLLVKPSTEASQHLETVRTTFEDCDDPSDYHSALLRTSALLQQGVGAQTAFSLAAAWRDKERMHWLSVGRFAVYGWDGESLHVLKVPDTLQEKLIAQGVPKQPESSKLTLTKSLPLEGQLDEDDFGTFEGRVCFAALDYDSPELVLESLTEGPHGLSESLDGVLMVETPLSGAYLVKGANTRRYLN